MRDPVVDHRVVRRRVGRTGGIIIGAGNVATERKDHEAYPSNDG
jgi:hypothetical protein